MEIVDKVIPDERLAVINYKGPIEDVDVLIAKLLGWVEAEEVETTSEPFIIYYSPRFSYDAEEVVFDIGVNIIGNPDGNDLVKVADLVEHTVLSGIHNGSRENIQESYNQMVEIAEKNNFHIIGSPKEIFIKNHYDVNSEDEIITEIHLPIIKM